METYNVCGGANKADAHYININPKRDFNTEDIIVAPIRLITKDDVCPECHSPLEYSKGIEVGQVFKLGTKYSESYKLHTLIKMVVLMQWLWAVMVLALAVH